MRRFAWRRALTFRRLARPRRIDGRSRRTSSAARRGRAANASFLPSSCHPSSTFPSLALKPHAVGQVNNPQQLELLPCVKGVKRTTGNLHVHVEHVGRRWLRVDKLRATLVSRALPHHRVSSGALENSAILRVAGTALPQRSHAVMLLALVTGASLSTQCSRLSLAVPAHDAANTLQASLTGWSVPQVPTDTLTTCQRPLTPSSLATAALASTIAITTTIALTSPATTTTATTANRPPTQPAPTGEPTRGRASPSGGVASLVVLLQGRRRLPVASFRGRPECRKPPDFRARSRRRGAPEPDPEPEPEPDPDPDPDPEPDSEPAPMPTPEPEHDPELDPP